MTSIELASTTLPAIVGFISLSRFERHDAITSGSIELSPDIFGTGFLISEDGLVATNRHVTEEFSKYPPHPQTSELGVAAIVQIRDRNEKGYGGGWQLIKISHWHAVGSFSVDGVPVQIPELIPDLAFVQLRVKRTPYLIFDSDEWSVRTGMNVATLGYPLGTFRASNGRIRQVSPYFRRGVVSSVFPFDVPKAQGFTIDILQQGGSSRSPILNEDGKVVGMMAASLLDSVSIQRADGTVVGCYAPQNTNISICEGSTVLSKALAAYLELDRSDKSGFPELKDLLGDSPNGATHFSWDVFAKRG